MNFNEDVVVIDIETTGKVSGVSEIIEVGLLHVRIKEDFTYEVKSKFTSLLQPLKWNLINPQAMKINKIKKEDLLEAPFPQEVRGDLTEWWEDCLGGRVCDVLGHNFSGFDKAFLKIYLNEAYNKMFDYHAECTWAFAKGLQRQGKIPKDVCLSLDPLTEYFNIPLKAHRAIDDCFATLNLYCELLKL